MAARSTGALALVRARQVLERAESRAGVRHAGERIALPRLRGLFPEGLAPGSVTQIDGSTSVVFSLVAAAMGVSGWAAILGMRHVGWAAAQDAGVDVSRVVVVPTVTSEGVAVCVDYFDVVVVGEGVEIAPGERRSLMGRIRKCRTVVISGTAWPGAARVEAHVISSEGCGQGDGYVHRRLVEARRTDIPAHARLSSGVRIEEITAPVPLTRDRDGTRARRGPVRYLRVVGDG